MKKNLKKTLLSFGLGLSGGVMAAAPFPWPNGAKYAVSLTYDDALASHIKNAAPALDKAGLKGTFFLSGAPYTDPATLTLWVPLAKAGHEMASHSIRHPCPAEPGVSKPVGTLETYDLDSMEKELVETRRVLAKFGPKAGRTFAYPCGADFVGKDKANYRPLVAKHFFAARNAWGGIADPWSVDLNGVTTLGGDRKAPELVKDAEAAKASGGWAVYLFHGVGGDYLDVSLEAHQALIDHLKASKGEAWVAPFGDVAAWVKAHRQRHP